MSIHSKISAILPCFNHEKFLEERLSSILAQTHPVSEIIFLDDCSTDNSLDLAKRLLSSSSIDVRYVRNTTNSGSPFCQWNRGILLAKYPYVWIAETDDSCDVLLLERLSNRLLMDSSVIAFSQSRFLSSNGQDLGSALSYTNRHWPGKFRSDFSMDGQVFIDQFLCSECAIPNASAALINRAAYISSDLANESMKFCGDWDMWIRLLQCGSISFISDELNFFRCHPSTTRSIGISPKAAAEKLACRLSASCSIPSSTAR